MRTEIERRKNTTNLHFKVILQRSLILPFQMIDEFVMQDILMYY